ncbi:hypothetical protein ACFQRL_00865 [Microbacterium fluvii]|uniref:Sortase n=1 Tax=Microbacterium fluvii TaxID=415215 RepID=A0ABW2HAN4_9MICO|nr:hypothetical protein [Microbacterium fluvii]MCU4671137.1 hypothetical protein [Microbacterium fluvii]
MKKTIKATAAAALLAVAIFAAPAAANAYIPSGDITGPATIAPGGSGTFSFAGFDPSETVSFTLTGENGAGATLAFVKFAVSSASTTKTAGSDGAASVAVTLPSNASGDYTLTGTGATSGIVGSTVLSVAADGTATTDDLAGTGSDSTALLGLWVGGGALVLAGASIAVAATVRRQRQSTSA